MKLKTLLLSVGMAVLACHGALRADQFGLIDTVGNPGAAPPAQAGLPLDVPLPQVASAPPAPQYDWFGRQTSFDTAISGPETQIGSSLPCEEDCCLPPWAHRTGVFGELLFLRARDAEVAYGVPVDGPIVPGVPGVQVGRIGVADPDYAGGFRLGATWACDECSSVVFTWSQFETSTNDAIATTAPDVIRSLVLHPGTANAGADFLNARAVSDVDFDLLDIDYRAVWSAGDLWAVNYLIGFRYARLDQDFTGIFTNTGTLDTLVTNSNFEGAGLKLGLDAEKHACNSGLFVYGRTTVSFIAGDARASYQQGSDVDPVIVNTNWEAGRIVTIYDLEVGLGWQSANCRWRINGGYLFNSWCNVAPTDQWIRSVQRNNFVGLGDESITFDGFTLRLTYNW